MEDFHGVEEIERKINSFKVGWLTKGYIYRYSIIITQTVKKIMFVSKVYTNFVACCGTFKRNDKAGACFQRVYNFVGEPDRHKIENS